jgi:hypothetical protein
VLGGEESKGMLRMSNLNIQEMISVSVKEPGTGAAVSAIFKLRDNKSTIKTKAGGNVPEVFIQTKANATMIQFGGNVGAISPGILRACEEELEAQVKRELETTLAKAQRNFKTDFIGIGQLVYQQHRKEWKTKYKAQWDEVFPEIPFHIDIHVKILNSGTKVVPLSEQ